MNTEQKAESIAGLVETIRSGSVKEGGWLAVIGIFGRVVFAAELLISGVTASDAMSFTWTSHLTVFASGPIEAGDAAKFAALANFDTLQLDSPGGLVEEALAIAANMDARGGIRTEVRPGSTCASACAMALFVSGATRVVYMGGRLGIHSCATPDGTPVVECNEAMAANATAHGVPWGVIEGLGNYTDPSNMAWIDAEEAESMGLMKWSPQDTSNDGIPWFKYSLLTTEKGKPADVTVQNADDVLCRMNASTSSLYITTGAEGQGFSDAYREGCERVAADPGTPKYGAIDIILWLTLTDPNVLAMKPGTLMAHIFNDDDALTDDCWKCLTIIGMTELMHGYPREALEDLQKAVSVSETENGAVPRWLTSRVDIAAQAANSSQ